MFSTIFSLQNIFDILNAQTVVYFHCCCIIAILYIYLSIYFSWLFEIKKNKALFENEDCLLT